MRKLTIFFVNLLICGLTFSLIEKDRIKRKRLIKLLKLIKVVNLTNFLPQILKYIFKIC